MNQLLQNGEFRIRFHASHKAQHRLRSHFRIRIKAEHKVMPIRVMVQKFHHIAGFEAGVLRAAPVMRGDGLRGGKGAAGCFFGARFLTFWRQAVRGQ